MTSVPGLEGMAFGLEAERVLELPVAVENDINLAALGEHWLGVARGVDDFIFLSVGTGLGAGLVLRGELHRGGGAAGELDRLRRPRVRHRPVRRGPVRALGDARRTGRRHASRAALRSARRVHSGTRG